MRLVLHREIPEDQGLRNDWNGLVHQMERPEVFYTFEWAKAMQCAYHTLLKPMLFLGYEGDKLAGIAVLATNGKEDKAFFLASATADYCDFVSAPERRPEFVNDVVAALQKTKTPKLVLANLPAESATCSALIAALPEQGYRAFSRPAYRCAQVFLRSAEERQTIRQSIQRRKNKRQQFAAMERIAPVTLDHLTSAAEIVQALPDFARMHVARCLFTGRLSNLIFAERRTFLKELSARLSWAGWMTLSRLTVGERVVAWNYGFQFGGSWFWYQPAFEVGWQQYSPGFYLLNTIVEQACSDDCVKAVDLGLGAETYKDRLANGFRDTLHMTATARMGEWAREVARYRAVTTIQQMPRVENCLRSARARGSRILERARTFRMKSGPGWLWILGRRLLGFREEIQFFEGPEAGEGLREQSSTSAVRLHSLDLETLATASIHYSHDAETLAYILRSAARLRSDRCEGFALTGGDRAPVHIFWAAKFEGFFNAELGCKLKAPSEDAFLLFDFWPVSRRNQGLDEKAIWQMASRLSAAGKRAWVFRSTASKASIQGLEDVGFVPKFSLTRRWGFLSTRPSSAPSLAKPGARARASSAA